MSLKKGRFWRRVVRVHYENIAGRRWAVGGTLECQHRFAYERRRRVGDKRGAGMPLGAPRSCLECAAAAGSGGREAPGANGARAGISAARRLNGASPDLVLLRAALRRLVETTRTSPAPDAVRRFCLDALGHRTTEEAMKYVDTLQRLGEVVLEFLNGHPYGERAMALREEMSRLCVLAELLPIAEELPEMPGTPRRVAAGVREED